MATSRAFNLSVSKSLVPTVKFRQTQKKLRSYLAKLKTVAADSSYAAPESSIRLPFDAGLRRRVWKLANELRTPKLRYVVVIGIGGSNLGTMAVLDALRGPSSWQTKQKIDILFADTVEPEMIEQYRATLRAMKRSEEVIFCIVSKSGNTTETIANASILINAVPPRQRHCVAITDQGSALSVVAEKEHWHVLTIPKQVGGRFSVLSAVGLFPLALVGVDIDELHAGARQMAKHSFDAVVNPAVQSAAALQYQLNHGKIIHDTFVFRSQLESVGRWYRQLTGESLGKERNRQGQIVHAGFTPTVSVGSTDLHSVGQLYLGGPIDKITTFIFSEPTSARRVTSQRLTSLVQGMNGKTLPELLEAILNGITTAYAKRKLPYMMVRTAPISPFMIGQLLQWKMLEIMLLGKLMNVNAFDQPNVEEYKTITRKLLLR